MNLHKNIQDFYDTILIVADRLNTSPAIIEKDYYVTMFLEALSKKIPNLLFKGGTSLSKCYKVIKRFSEDIDITLDINNQTQSNKKNLKTKILEVCNELGFEIINEKDILSRRDYNKYEIKYPIYFQDIGIKQFLLVETVFMVKSYPAEIKIATSMIYDFFKNNNDELAIRAYEMYPFEIRVQTLERTLIDKVFALCDYAVSNNTTGYSRHLYDIYKLLEVIELNDKLKELVREVKKSRKEHERCYTAQDQYDIQIILKEIVCSKIYFNDYEKITKKVLFEEVNYEKSITALQKIIESKIFEK